MKKKMSCPKALKANKAISLTLYYCLVSFVSIIFFNEIQSISFAFVDEVNIGKEVIFDVYDTSTSLSVSESRECNTEKKKYRKCDFFYVRFVFSFPRVLFFTLASRIFLLE